MGERITFVGLDVHKATIAVCVAEAGRDGEVRFVGEIPNEPAALTSWRPGSSSPARRRRRAPRGGKRRRPPAPGSGR